MDYKAIFIAAVVGPPFIAIAYFTVLTFRSLDPNSASWQRTCTKWLVTCIAFVGMFMATVALVPYPYSMLDLIPLALCAYVRGRFVHQAARHAKVMHDAGQEIG